MVERSEQLPHIQLRMTAQGSVKPFIPIPRKQNPQTAANLGDRQGHGRHLKNSLESLIFYWQETQEQRDEEGKPPLPDKAKPIILQIDPTAFDSEDLRKYGIEVIAELENGYIVGASVNDSQFSELQQKIEKFIKEEKGGNKISEIWDIIDGSRRPEYILSEELFNEWEQIRDEQIYTVDVGISCIGTKSQFPNFPKQKSDQSNDKYSKLVNKWISKRDSTYEEWDDLAFERQQDLVSFVESYDGIITSSFKEGNIPNAAKLPDSFSCRIQISGKGLKDLVFNFPYIFDISEPDEFAEIITENISSDANTPTFSLEMPDFNAPKVCVIDSGIQERHSLLKSAIDSANSRSWVPGEIHITADCVNNGGHGTRVAGAIIYGSIQFWQK